MKKLLALLTFAFLCGCTSRREKEYRVGDAALLLSEASRSNERVEWTVLDAKTKEAMSGFPASSEEVRALDAMLEAAKRMNQLSIKERSKEGLSSEELELFVELQRAFNETMSGLTSQYFRGR